MSSHSPLSRFGELIEQQVDSIAERWLVQVRHEFEVDELADTELRDSVPDYLIGLARVLRKGDSPRTSGQELWAGVAQQHAVARVHQGFKVSSLLREFILLREVLTERAQENGFHHEAVFDAITQSIEEAVVSSVNTYVEFRDDMARRAEAKRLGFITHELRNPLSNALLAVVQVQSALHSNGEPNAILAVAERNLHKLRDIIENVLAVSRLEGGEVEPNPAKVALRPLIEQAIGDTMPMAQFKNLHIDAQWEEGVDLMVDPRLTRSALQNLLDNAIKYSDKSPIKLWTEHDPSHVSIHVNDRCGGLSEEERQNLFTPFRRGKHRSAAGYGLGLSIAKRAIEAQGGSIECESIEDGCHFWITLPRQAHP